MEDEHGLGSDVAMLRAGQYGSCTSWLPSSTALLVKTVQPSRTLWQVPSHNMMRGHAAYACVHPISIPQTSGGWLAGLTDAEASTYKWAATIAFLALQTTSFEETAALVRQAAAEACRAV